jgi:hypothetical protein
MNIETILAVMEEIEKDNPIDFADLPFNENEMRSVVATQLSHYFAELEKEYPESSERELFWVSMLVHQVMENMVLNARLLVKDNDSARQTKQFISGLRKKF